MADYRAVLAVAPDDPAGWNNLGNASNGLGRWGARAQLARACRAPRCGLQQRRPCRRALGRVTPRLPVAAAARPAHPLLSPALLSCRWEEAVEYYTKAVALAPAFSFAVANRALAMYQLGRTNEAIKEYRSLLRRWAGAGGPAGGRAAGRAVPEAWGLGGHWQAVVLYQRLWAWLGALAGHAHTSAGGPAQLGAGTTTHPPTRSTAPCRAPAQTPAARYPDFTDMRAALAAALWADGREADAESAWERVEDSRYKDRRWLRSERRWPPKMVAALEAFLDLRSV